ncbi:hypothetical protein YH62_19230 [Rhizobium sp. LC145]|nr:hypothetical protein YH62_19230 [Rhizobium sp. LC145]
MMSRRELALLHADEMNAALNPFPGRPDDEITAEEKAEIANAVSELQRQHLRELSAWEQVNG